MYRFGRFAVIVGIALTALGIIVGFGAMFNDADELAKPFIALVPIGFVILFAGVTTVLLSSPGKGER